VKTATFWVSNETVTHSSKQDMLTQAALTLSFLGGYLTFLCDHCTLPMKPMASPTEKTSKQQKAVQCSYLIFAPKCCNQTETLQILLCKCS